MTQLHFKTELADGEVHMTAHDYCQHKTKEWYQQHKQELRKIANNPILSDEVKQEIRVAVYCMDDNEFYLKRIEELNEEIENMKKARIYVK